MEAKGIREGDVFSFSYNAEMAGRLFSPYHCFDGQLVATETATGIRLVDTYWGDNSSRSFTLIEAARQGILRFVCNLNDVVIVGSNKEQVENYYSSFDWFNLSYQHGCYKRFALRKGAKRNLSVMLQAIEFKIAEKRGEIEYANRSIEMLEESKNQVIEGKLDDIYISS